MMPVRNTKLKVIELDSFAYHRFLGIEALAKIAAPVTQLVVQKSQNADG